MSSFYSKWFYAPGAWWVSRGASLGAPGALPAPVVDRV